MADVIARFKGDTSDLDSKLNKATKVLQDLGNESQKAGNKIGVANEKNVSFARSLGSMEVNAKSAKGKIGELNTALTEARLVYNRLTDQEKKSPFGRELGKSIETLKGRLSEAKTELSAASGEAQKSSGVLDTLAGKFGLNAKSLLSFGSATAAASAALKLAKDAFLSTEAGVDEWGRTMEAAKTTYNTFCQSLANGSFDTFLSNLDNIIQKAKDTYNALDNLKTVGGIISNQEAMLNSQRAKALKTIKDPNATKAQKDAARSSLENIQKQKASATEATKNLNNDYIKKALRSQAGLLTDAEYKKYYQLIVKSFYDSAAKDALDQVTIKKTKTHTRTDQWGNSTTYETGQNIKLGDLFTDAFREGLNPYIQAYWNADQRKWTDERADNRVLGGGAGGSGGGKGGGSVGASVVGGSIGDYKKQISELQKELDATTDHVAYQAIQDKIDELNQCISVIKNGKVDTNLTDMTGVSVSDVAKSAWKIDVPKELTRGDLGLPEFETDSIAAYNAKLQELAGLLDTLTIGSASYNMVAEEINKTQEELNVKKGEALAQAGKNTQTSWKGAASAVGSVGAALQQIDDPVAKVMGIVAEAIANVAGGLMTAFASDASTNTNIYAKIAAGAAATATMISMISSIKSATQYANGGVVRAANGYAGFVPGNNMSGDMVPALLNSGELVLNKAQQGNLASQLSGNNILSGLHIETSIREDKLIVMLNNGLRKRGKGTIVTSR